LVGADPPATYTVMILFITAAPELAITSISTGTSECNSRSCSDVALAIYKMKKIMARIA
jgi:hypothetical protein